MTQRVTGQRFRQRKLSTKQNLPILRESDLEKLPDDEAQRHIPRVETGVEKGEETEHHLQAVISASQAAATGGQVAQLYIPTPDAVASSLRYEDLYPLRFSQPATYIRFSSTVEDCTGCPYCMATDDLAFLKGMNQKKSKSTQCTPDQFEEAMNFFEETAQTKQPYAAVDNPPVVPYEEMEAEFDETISEPTRRFAKDIYDHWKTQRLLTGNRSLMPTLKFETNLETDDADPYVCFRRREVRQVRKTRGRDAQVTEKLKKLRKELEEVRYLMSRVKDREVLNRDNLALDRKVFEQRAMMKEAKRKLNIKEDDELLINQKPPQKPKPRVDPTAVQRGIPGMGPRPQLTRPDGRLLESDLVSLDEQQATQRRAIKEFVQLNLTKHKSWNERYVDHTWRPITPPLEPASTRNFRPVFTQQLPTPPASVSSETSGENQNVDQAKNKSVKLREAHGPVVRYASPPDDVSYRDQSRYRLRKGRGGRMMVDRRGIKRPSPADFEEVGTKRLRQTLPIDERVQDRFKYAGESSEDEQIMDVDWTGNVSTKYRIMRIMIDSQGEKNQAAQARRAIGEVNNLHQHHNRSSSGHLLPPSNTAG